MHEQAVEMNLKTFNVLKENLNMELYLDILFTELAPAVFIFFRFFPGALSCLQVIVEVIFVLDAVLYPQHITAAWKRKKNFHTHDLARSHLPYFIAFGFPYVINMWN